jgi:hypothetical protein
VRLNYLHEVVNQGTIILKYIDTLNQVADILTKPLPIHSHQHFLEILTQGHFGNIPEPKAKVIYKFKRENKFKQFIPGNLRGFKFGSSTGHLSLKPPTAVWKGEMKKM